MSGNTFHSRIQLLLLVLLLTFQTSVAQGSVVSPGVGLTGASTTLTITLTFKATQPTPYQFGVQLSSTSSYPIGELLSGATISSPGVTVAFNPAAISSSDATAYIQITSPASLTGTLILTVSGYKNPPYVCSTRVKFQCPTTYDHIDSTYTVTANTLSTLTVTPDTTSSVGSSSSLTLRFSPRNCYPMAGWIKLTGNPTLAFDSTVTIYSVAISVVPKVGATCSATATATYSSNVLTISTNGLCAGITTLTSDDALTITLYNVVYSPKMSAQPITLSTFAYKGCTTTTTGAPMEETPNSNSWVPEVPAALISPTCVISSADKTVFSSATITCTFTAFMDIAANSAFLLVPDGIKLTLPPTTYSSTFVIFQLDGENIKAVSDLTTSWSGLRDHPGDTKTVTIEFSPVELPSTETPFRFNISTYASSNIIFIELVQTSFTGYVNAVRRYDDTFRGISIASPTMLTVGETADYTITITSTYGLSANANYKISFPSIYTATATTCVAPDCTLGTNEITLSNKGILTANVAFPLTFQLVNPSSIKPVFANFTVVAFDKNAAGTYYASFQSSKIITPTYIAGTFSAFSVTPARYNVAATCLYTFVITVNHAIPSSGSVFINFTAGATVPSPSTSVVTLDSVTLSTGQYSISGTTLNITSLAKAYSSGDKITVTVTGVKNPSTASNVEFKAVSQAGGYDIDTSTDSESINLPAAADANCTLTGSTVNAAQGTYTCIFKPQSNPDVKLADGTQYYLDVTLDSNLKGCTFSLPPISTLMFVSNSINVFKLQMDPAISPSTVTELQAVFTCKNAPSTEPVKIDMTLYSSSLGIRSNVLNNLASVETDTGMALVSPSCKSSTPYPYYPTNVSLIIGRSTTTLIRKIYIYVPSLDDTTACKITGITHTCVKDTTLKGNLLVTFDTDRADTQFTITLIKSKNPQMTTTVVDSFKVWTYTSTGYIVDEDENVCKLSVSCDYPCANCDSALLLPKNCTDCAEVDAFGAPASYYYLDDIEKCELSCPVANGYYEIKATLKCLKCHASCAQCDGSTTKCTECADTTLFLHDGACIPECPSHYYPGTTDKKCYVCDANCQNCTAASAATDTGCSTCADPYYLYNGNHTCLNTCPSEFYQITANRTCGACASPCVTCVSSATTCLTCKDLKYVRDGQCFTKEDCIATKEYIADLNTYKCVACALNCTTCMSTNTTCLSCIGTYKLSGTSCVERCGATEYEYTDAGIQKCTACVPLCATCKNATSCLTCVPNTYLAEDTNECVTSCGSYKYYVTPNNHCGLCNTVCAKCETSASNCIACDTGFFLYQNTCLSECPTSSFQQGTECIACSTNCTKCSGTAAYCTSCPASYSLDVSVCLKNCSTGKTGIDGVCKACEGLCASCAGATTYCTSCQAGYLYDGTCVSSCPSYALPTTVDSVKVCLNCSTGCSTCSWSSSSNATTICNKCTSGYLMLDYACYSTCPSGYQKSTDGLSCVKTSGGTGGNGTDNSTTNSTAKAVDDYIPFPHLIAAGVLGFFAIAGQVREPRSMAISNAVMTWSYVALCSYVIQALLALSAEKTLVCLISAGVVGLTFLLNVIYLAYYAKKISRDTGFVAWGKEHGCAKTAIVTFSTLIDLQTSRLFYSRFLGFSLFFALFQDFMNILVPLNIFSFLQLILTHFPVVVMDVIALNTYSWGDQLYITLIESLILSLLLIILLCYEMKSVKDTRKELLEDGGYTGVNDDLVSINGTTPKPFNEDDLRKKVMEDVFTKLGLDKTDRNGSETGRESPRLSPQSWAKSQRKRPKRRRSFESKSGVKKEELDEEPHSYPCSPRTAKSKEVPLKEYGIDEDAQIPPQDLPDNVYSESKKPDSSGVVNVRPSEEVGSQTPPFKKLQAFKKHLKADEHRRAMKNRKLFEIDANGDPMSNPLEPIAESPEDNDENGPKHPGIDKNPEEEKKSDPKEADSKVNATELPTELDGKGKPGSELQEVLLRKGSQKEFETEEAKAERVKPGSNLNTDTNAKLNTDEARNLSNLSGLNEESKLGLMENSGKKPLASATNKAAGTNPGFNLPLPAIAPSAHDSKASEAGENPASVADGKEDGPIIVDAFETGKVSMGEGDSSTKQGYRRNIHSPPQKAPEALDPFLSAPLTNPVLQGKSATGAAPVGEEEEAKAGRKTLAEVQKTPDLFEEDDGFKFSITNRKLAPENNDKAKEKEAANPSVEPTANAGSVPEATKDVPPPPLADAGTTPVEEFKKEEGEGAMSKGLEKEPSRNTVRPEESERINEADIMGSFERDPVDDYLLIKEDDKNQLVDLRGRKVNKRGYLIDGHNNIINRKGEIIYRYEDIEKDPDDEDNYAPPVVQNNKLFESNQGTLLDPHNAIPIVTPTSTGMNHTDAKEEKPTPVEHMASSETKKADTPQQQQQNDNENAEDDRSSSRESVAINPLMGDTPSNYNLQNQRYDDPLDNSRRAKESKQLVGRPPPLKYKVQEREPPREHEVKLARAYGGPPQGAPVRRIRRKKDKSKSANKRREPEKLFTVNKLVEADKHTGFASDAEGRPAPERLSDANNAKLPEETKGSKPVTARGESRRTKSRKATQREKQGPDELEKAYGANIEDMFLYSDNDNEDGMSMAPSIAPSNASKASNKSLMPRLKGLEGIYLQRLESSAKHNKKKEKRERMHRELSKLNKKARESSESEQDEISSKLAENYNEMQSKFLRENASMMDPKNVMGEGMHGTDTNDVKTDGKSLFPGNMKLYQEQ